MTYRITPAFIQGGKHNGVQWPATVEGTPPLTTGELLRIGSLIEKAMDLSPTSEVLIRDADRDYRDEVIQDRYTEFWKGQQEKLK